MPLVVGQTVSFVNNASSVVVSLPAGTQAGHLLIIATGHGWVPNLPSGWTSKDAQNGSNVNGAVYTKTATAADITAGNITVTYSNGYYGEAVLVAVSSGMSIRETKMVRSGGGSASVSVTTTGAAVVGDLALYFGINRASSSATTFDRGTLLASRTTDNEAAAGVASEAITTAGTVTVQIAHSVPGSGYYDGIILVQDGSRTTGDSPVSDFTSSLAEYRGTRTSGLSPVDVFSSSFSPTDFETYPDEDGSVVIPFEFSGLIDPDFPPPTPPVNFEGLPDPTVAPTLSKSDTAGGHLPPGTYRYSYAAWKGSESQATAPAPTADITLTTEDTVTLSFPTIAGADGYLVYREEL